MDRLVCQNHLFIKLLFSLPIEDKLFFLHLNLRSGYRLDVCVPQNLYLETLALPGMVLGGGVWGGN